MDPSSHAAVGHRLAPARRPAPHRGGHVPRPQFAPTGPDAFLPVDTRVIRGEQPIVVDTGAPIHRVSWFPQAFSLVDPKAVRWFYLSHDDGDHTGNLHDVLDRCPNATLVGNFVITVRLALEGASARPHDLAGPRRPPRRG